MSNGQPIWPPSIRWNQSNIWIYNLQKLWATPQHSFHLYIPALHSKPGLERFSQETFAYFHLEQEYQVHRTWTKIPLELTIWPGHSSSKSKRRVMEAMIIDNSIAARLRPTHALWWASLRFGCPLTDCGMSSLTEDQQSRDWKPCS